MSWLLEPFLEAYPWWRPRAWVLAVLLLMGPAAFWTGREIQLKTAAESKYEIEGYRETLTRAHAAAKSLMIDTKGWRHIIRFGTNDGMTRYEYWQGPRLPEAVRRVLPVAMVSVLLHAPDRARWVEFTFNQHGQLMQFQPSPGLFSDKSGERAIDGRAVAQAAVYAVLDPSAFTLGEAASQTTNAGKSDRFEWSAKANCCRDLEVNAAVEVEGRKPSYLRVATWFTADYLRHLSTPVNLAADLLRWAYLLGAGLFVSLRFAQRAMEREVPLGRAGVILGIIVAVSFVLLMLMPTANSSFNASPGIMLGSAWYLILVLNLIIPIVLGILLGLAYGATEGDMRERFEGRLTSLDTLLSGAVASRNAGVAVLAGAAWGGWAHLITQAARRWVAPGFISLPGSELRYSYTPLPWIGLLGTTLLDAVVVAITVLPVPLAIGLWARSRPGATARRGWLLTALASAGALLLQSPLADAAAMVTALSSFVTLWLGFGGLDLLAALVALLVTRFGASLVDLIGVMPAWADSAPMARSVAFAALAAAGYAVLRGRRYADAEVRPKYAQNIEERQMRQAEVTAAREAQLRLLPDKPPEVPGLGVAAFCAPAQGVSGDFFDFFPMPRGRLGVFVADGRAGGLSAALTIALAKGFLQYAAQRDWSCGEALARLRDVMAKGDKAAAAGGELNLTLAVLDPVERRLQFARLGATPVLLAGLDARDEARVLTGLASNGLTEGQASFSAGDVLLIYTDGVPQRLADKQREKLEDWLRNKLRLTTGVTAYRIGEALQESLRAHEGNAPDDLTAVVIRFEQAQALEVVA